jgi:hypothetical protein
VSFPSSFRPHGIICLEFVELLFNLMWAAVIAALWAFWLGRRFRRGASPQPGIGVQLLALVTLSAILLPVISITDDLQAARYPAEVQRAGDRSERHTLLGNAPHSLPVALAILVFSLRAPARDDIASLTANDPISRNRIVFERTLWSRPPPSA